VFVIHKLSVKLPYIDFSIECLNQCLIEAILISQPA